MRGFAWRVWVNRGGQSWWGEIKGVKPMRAQRRRCVLFLVGERAHVARRCRRESNVTSSSEF